MRIIWSYPTMFPYYKERLIQEYLYCRRIGFKHQVQVQTNTNTDTDTVKATRWKYIGGGSEYFYLDLVTIKRIVDDKILELPQQAYSMPEEVRDVFGEEQTKSKSKKQ